ncbi:Nitrate transporter 1.5 [Glycine soja]|uniref:Nitrate transporter 1.5 n=1 Tax=Glycine soja TaxID=3848 RepID=A0A0B2Q0N0_GLYSO|nr:Nitrate transporter 1.5 [Glycine soja]
MEEKINKEHQVCTSDGAIDSHGHPAVRKKTGDCVAAILILALGNGGYQPNIATFGADQFDEGDPREQHSKIVFFSYFYLALNIGSLFSNTILNYFEDDDGLWTLGFWASAGSICCSGIDFVSLWHTKAKVLQDDKLYEVDEFSTNEGRKMFHTEGFRFLDKAAFITSKNFKQMEESKCSPWYLSIVTQQGDVMDTKFQGSTFLPQACPPLTF